MVHIMKGKDIMDMDIGLTADHATLVCLFDETAGFHAIAKSTYAFLHFNASVDDSVSAYASTISV